MGNGGLAIGTPRDAVGVGYAGWALKFDGGGNESEYSPQYQKLRFIYSFQGALKYEGPGDPFLISQQLLIDTDRRRPQAHLSVLCTDP